MSAHDRIVTVVVPTYREPLLERCLEALSNVELPPSWRTEIIVVDNGSGEPPVDIVSRFPPVRLLEEPRPGSYAARNAGIAAATGEVVAFTDADCRPEPTWLTAALGRLLSDADPGVAAVAGRVSVVFEDGGPSTGPGWWEAIEAFPQEWYVEFANFGVTANLVVRADVVASLGGFDSRAISGGDADFGARLTAAGYRMVYEQSAVVLHPPRATWTGLLRKARRTTKGSSRLEQLRGRTVWGYLATLPPQARRVAGIVWRACTDARLPGPRARLGYLAAGLAVRSIVFWEGLASEIRYRRGERPITDPPSGPTGEAGSTLKAGTTP